MAARGLPRSILALVFATLCSLQANAAELDSADLPIQRPLLRDSRVASSGSSLALWDGRLSNGARALPGVYFFYALEGLDIAPGAARASKMILLSSRQEQP